MTNATWNVQLTVNLLREKLNNGHEEARRSLISVLDRQEYARYHYHEVATRWSELMTKASSADERWRILGWTSSKEERDLLNEVRLVMSANLIACVQTLHAIPDTLAFALFHSLQLSLPRGKDESHINAGSVGRWLAANPDLAIFSRVLQTILTSPTFLHLQALSNHGKHRSIIEDSMSADVTGTDTVPMRLRFAGFSFKGMKYPIVDALPLLATEFDRMSPIIIECGQMLNSYLELSPDRAVGSTAL